MRAKKREFEEKKQKKSEETKRRHIINEEFGKDVHENLSLF